MSLQPRAWQSAAGVSLRLARVLVPAISRLQLTTHRHAAAACRGLSTRRDHSSPNTAMGVSCARGGVYDAPARALSWNGSQLASGFATVAPRRAFFKSPFGFGDSGSSSSPSTADGHAAFSHEQDTFKGIPKGAEGIPFRLTPKDAITAYAKWSNDNTPFLSPKTPKRLSPIYVPFWMFDFTLKVTHKPSGSVAYVPYRHLPLGTRTTDLRHAAVQMYAGYDFARAMVEPLKPPPRLARPWDGARMLRVPKDDATSVFVPLTSTASSSSSSSSTSSSPHSSSATHSEERDHSEQLSLRIPRLQPLEVDDWGVLEPTAWSHVRRNVELLESALYEAGGEYAVDQEGRAISDEDEAVTGLGADAEAGSGAGAPTQRPAPLPHEVVPPRPPLTVAAAARSAARSVRKLVAPATGRAMGRARGGVGSSDGGATAASTVLVGGTDFPAGAAASDLSFEYLNVISRRVYVPGYVTEYSHLFSRWRVFTSAVTGRTFGIPQHGFFQSLEHAAAPILSTSLFSGLLGSLVTRRLLMIPAVAGGTAAAAVAYGLARKLSPLRYQRRMDRRWRQVAADERKMQEEMRSVHELWLHRPSPHTLLELHSKGKAEWEQLKEQDLRARRMREARAAEALRVKLEAEAQEREQREAEERALERARLRALPPPAIPTDTYELLGLSRPTTRGGAALISQHDIRNGYRREMLRYHPDAWREEVAEFSIEYAEKRTQAITMAYQQVRNARAKHEHDVNSYPLVAATATHTPSGTADRGLGDVLRKFW